MSKDRYAIEWQNRKKPIYQNKAPQIGTKVVFLYGQEVTVKVYAPGPIVASVSLSKPKGTSSGQMSGNGCSQAAKGAPRNGT